MWTTLSDQFGSASKALKAYAASITSAQSKAAEAIEKWAKGERATASAVSAYNTAVDAYNSSCRVPSSVSPMGPARPGPFVDPGESFREQARGILQEARESLEKSAGSAMAALGAMPGAKTSGSTSGPNASGSAEGPKFSWGSDSSFGKDPNKGKNGKYDGGIGDGGPFSLSLGELAAEAHVWQAKGSVEDYWGAVKVHANGDVSVLGADADASAKLDKNGLNLNATADAYLAKVRGEAGGEWGYAEGKVDGEASLGADAEGNVVITKTRAHAGGELFPTCQAGVRHPGAPGPPV